MTERRNVMVSVIIVTYNNKGELDECLRSIFEMNDIGDRLEVIVVDNSPDDSIGTRIASFPTIKYIRNELNGFGRGNNIGFRASTGDLLIFLNPDTKLVEPIFEKIVNHYYENSKCGMAGIRLLNCEGIEHNSFNIRLNYGLRKKIILHLCRKLKLFPERLMYTSGADIIMDRAIFSAIGMFDENIFMYGEEQDLANRVNLAGKELNYFSDLSMMHLQGMSTSDGVLRIHKRMIDSNRYYCMKYGIDFRKEMGKEIFAMRLINFVGGIVGKRKYSEELLELYMEER